MSWISRRRLLATTGLGVLTGGLRRAFVIESTSDSQVDKAAAESRNEPLALAQYQPVSMLHLKETHVPRARYPVIDFHTHLTFSVQVVKGISLGAERTIVGQPEELLPVMEHRNILTLTNLTGGFAAGLQSTVAQYDKRFPTRFYTFTEPSYNLFQQPNYPQLQADAILAAHQSGARGLKILKTLGLSLREQTTTGNLVKVDDPRFDPMWEACGGLGMPVAIHVSDPLAFFTPTDRFNERYEELNAHPEWSFYGKDFPTDRELQEARLRVIQRHPHTQFIVLHVGDAENLAYISQAMDRYPNMSVEFGARIGELGRQPRGARKFFDKYQDRILFGTDAVPKGVETPQQIFGERLYEIYYRFLETEDEYFDYAPAKKPPQGRWRISGLGLPDTILRKIYYDNAARLLGMKG